MNHILLIMSSDWCNPELQQEFGEIPAAFVPLGPKRLLDYQLMEASSFSRVYVTLPHRTDPKMGKDQEFTAIHLPPMSLEHAFACAIESICDDLPLYFIKENSVRLHVMFGDTLVSIDPKLKPHAGIVDAESVFNRDRLSRAGVFNGYFTAPLSRVVSKRTDMRGLIKSLPRRLYKDSDWLDFGHGDTYWKSKSQFLSSRSFNSVTVRHNQVVKTGPRNRIRAEVHWYNNIPSDVALYAPRIDNVPGSNSYITRYIPGPSLAEIWVHGNKSDDWWINTLEQSLVFIDRCQNYRPNKRIQDPLFLKKMRTRQLRTPYQNHGLVQQAIDVLKQMRCSPNIIHGDLCLSNIVYDSRTTSIQVIDPRGEDSDGKVSIYGETLYDLAKLYHSIYGGYDYIMAGQKIRQRPAVSAWFRDECESFGYEITDLTLMAGLLFTSMVPLHLDKPERAARLHERGLTILKSVLDK